MSEKRIIVAPDGAAFAATAAEEIVRLLAAAVGARGRASVALSGGSTPRPVYEALAGPPLVDRIPWGAVDLWFGDERCVSQDDPESNYGMARQCLLDRAPVDPARVHPIEADRHDREKIAEEYGRALPDPLDLLILGMGDDGHTASLFPGSPALGETARRAAVVRGPKPPAWRITITPPVIRSAREVIVLVTGAWKAEMVARALSGPFDPGKIPAQLARDRTWILDPAAGGKL